MKQSHLEDPPNLADVPALIAEMGQRPGALLPIIACAAGPVRIHPTNQFF